MRELYTFVDSSKIVACVDTWKARDRAIADAANDERDDDGNPTMNNRNLQRYSSDPQARFGAKGKNSIWVGYKRHVAVDMRHGLITRVAVIPANVHDGNAFKDVAPSQGAVIADKMYSDGPAAKDKTVAPGAISRNGKSTLPGFDGSPCLKFQAPRNHRWTADTDLRQRFETNFPRITLRTDSQRKPSRYKI